MGASDLPIGRWGNSLAVRIPAKLARELGVTEGSTLTAEVLGPARVRLSASPKPNMSMADFIKRIQALHARTGITQPVVEEMRRDARY
jgi:antitoxin component of MazEF toxin-antitoxin module